MSNMSIYGAMANNADYENKVMTLQLADLRARYLISTSPVNSRNVIVPNQAPLNLVANHASHPREYYAPYTTHHTHLGYQPGMTRVYRPRAQADPAPVHNQHELTSPNHTYHRFTASDLPPILFRLEPFRDTFRDNRGNDMPVPILCYGDTGLPVVTYRGATLRFFSFLPRYIAHSVPGALLEFWFRLDYRLEMNDILMRIETQPSNRVTANSLNMRRVRFRDAINVNAWMDCRTFPVQHDLDVVRTYSEYQICFNTCMKIHLPGQPGQEYFKPVFNNISCQQTALVGYVGARDPTTNARLPIEFFIQNPVTTFPTHRMIGIMCLLHQTQQLAIDLNHGNSWDNYKLLAEADAPPWWSDRRAGSRQAAGRQIGLIGDLTWKDWMTAVIGDDRDDDFIAKRARTRGQPV